MESIREGHLEIAQILIENGASIQYQDINNENSFHYAARSGNGRMIKLLASTLSPQQIQYLASVPSIRRKFPEDLASNLLCHEILKDFREQGCHITTSKKKKIKTVTSKKLM